MVKRAKSAVAFFLANAGMSYQPALETEREGHLRCARRLAQAERWLASQPGHTIEWLRDDNYDPADYDCDMPAIGWGCIVRVAGQSESLWAITFDGDGEPWGNAYARVVVAEIALELMPD